jgi:hypothetical protein
MNMHSPVISCAEKREETNQSCCQGELGGSEGGEGLEGKAIATGARLLIGLDVGQVITMHPSIIACSVRNQDSP